MGSSAWAVFDLSTNVTSAVLSGFSGTSVGFFVCGNAVQASELPTNIDITSCASNGLSWQLQYLTTTEYYLTLEAMEAKMQALAQPLCSSSAVDASAALYKSICGKVGNLPPYLCSRKKYPPVFSVLSVAIANSHLLGVLMFVLVGAWLPSICNTQSKQRTDMNDDQNRSDNASVDGAELTSTATAVDSNPIHRQKNNHSTTHQGV